jgi:protein-S-isoprenylcysteine O-methyltransferase Ste14
MEIKFIEEPELEKRFGDAYLEYKKEIPFMFPKWPKSLRF